MSTKANWQVGRMGPRQKAKARARLPQICAMCGAVEDLTIDHILARAFGGTNAINNLQMLCVNCNYSKSLAEQQVFLASRTVTQLENGH
jgi:5-methylcytosine-specific restriction endonuclease McrA